MGELFGVRPWEMGELRVSEMRMIHRYVEKRNSG